MTTWFISRHQGAIDWIKQQDIQIDKFVAHLNIDDIQQGDTVIGTLPIHLAAKVCEKGAKFLFLTIDLPSEQRGKELSAEQLYQQNCRLVPYYVHSL